MTTEIQVSGDTAQERLDSIGIDEISNMVSNGVRLRTHGNSNNTGLLNTIDVSQQEFSTWLSHQEPEKQLMFNNAVGLGAKGVASDLLHRSIDVIDDIDQLIQDMGRRGSTRESRDKLEFLKAKHGAATDTLRQLVALQKAMGTQPEDPTTPVQPASAQPSASVTMTKQQEEQIAKLKGDKK